MATFSIQNATINHTVWFEDKTLQLEVTEPYYYKVSLIYTDSAFQVQIDDVDVYEGQSPLQLKEISRLTIGPDGNWFKLQDDRRAYWVKTARDMLPIEKNRSFTQRFFAYQERGAPYVNASRGVFCRVDSTASVAISERVQIKEVATAACFGRSLIHVAKIEKTFTYALEFITKESSKTEFYFKINGSVVGMGDRLTQCVAFFFGEQVTLESTSQNLLQMTDIEEGKATEASIVLVPKGRHFFLEEKVTEVTTEQLQKYSDQAAQEVPKDNSMKIYMNWPDANGMWAECCAV